MAAASLISEGSLILFFGEANANLATRFRHKEGTQQGSQTMQWNILIHRDLPGYLVRGMFEAFC